MAEGTPEWFRHVGQPDYGHGSTFCPTPFQPEVYWNESQPLSERLTFSVLMPDAVCDAPSYTNYPVPLLSHQHPPATPLLHPTPYQQLHVEPSARFQTPLTHLENPPPPHVQTPPPHVQTPPPHFQTPPPHFQTLHHRYNSPQYSDTAMNSDSTSFELFPDLSGLSSTTAPPDLTSPPSASASPLCSTVKDAAGESDPHCLKLNPKPDMAVQTATTSTLEQRVPNCPTYHKGLKPFPVPCNEQPASSTSATTSCVQRQPASGENPAEATCYIPDRTPDPGQYGFRVKFGESQDARTSGSIWAYLEEVNSLVVQPRFDFPVTFTVDKPLPPNCHVRAVVCFKHTSDIQRHGPVTRCIHHLEKDKMFEHHEHFIVSKTAGATYSCQSSYNSVTVPVTFMPESTSFAVYSCTCFSSCRFNGKPAPPMVVIFSLTSVGEPQMSLGRDVVNIRVCASPSRDMRVVVKKARERRLQEEAGPHLPLATPPASKRRRVAVKKQCPKEDDRIQVQPPLDFVQDPDEEGYYTFTWRLKDKVIYNLLQMMKKGAEVANLG